MKTIDRRRGGFTLIEVLMALLLTAMVLTSVLGVLHDALTMRDRIHNLSQIQRTGPLILDRIEADLKAMAGFNVAGHKVFSGRNLGLGGADADSFDFVAYRSATTETEKSEGVFVRAPLCEIGYRLRPNPREPMFLELWRRESPYIDDDPFNGGTYVKLYDKITSFSATYFAEAGSAARSEDAWSSEEKQALPQRMQIDLELEIEPRIEATDRPLDYSRRRSFRRIFNFDADLTRVLAANVRPVAPDAPKADDSGAGAPAPGGAGATNVTGGSHGTAQAGKSKSGNNPMGGKPPSGFPFPIPKSGGGAGKAGG